MNGELRWMLKDWRIERDDGKEKVQNVSRILEDERTR